VLNEVLTDQPVPPPLQPEMSLREMALQEQSERAVELARHADDAMARERERERLDNKRHNEEFLRQQQSLSQ
jgi:hypothetical protein